MKPHRTGDTKAKVQVKKLDDMPRFRRASNFFLVIAILVAAVVLSLKYRASTVASQVLDEQNNFAAATEYLSNLKLAMPAQPMDDGQYANARSTYYKEGLRRADAALDEAGTTNPQLSAAALICKGDLNFAQADLPELPGAATQPSLLPDQPIATLLDNAADNYNQVLKNYPGDLAQVTAARFGLASVSEDRALTDGSQWDKARQYFQAVLDSDTSSSLKIVAQNRLLQLTDLAKPLIIDLPPVATTMPSTLPSALAPGLMGPMAPTTIPTTGP